MIRYDYLLESGHKWQKAAIEEQEMWFAAAQVIWMRSWQMMTGRMSTAEATRMVLEKPFAFARAAQNAGEAVFSGRDPVAITRAAVAPLRKEARKNARRLSR